MDLIAASQRGTSDFKSQLPLRMGTPPRSSHRCGMKAPGPGT
jgi:hypothetical protein